MTVGSLFSGVGGFDLGLERAGMRVLWQVEFDEQCQSVLRERFPETEIYGDVREVGAEQLGSVSLICGGFPCQDLSVAGKRAGLDGDRSGLWHEFHRIISEIAPRWVLIENVPGLLSSNDGRDMGVVVRGLEELGYGWAYRVLDSQYFGVAQRRRRVFIVGHLGTAEPAIRALFPVGTGLPGDTAPSRETGEGTAGSTGNGIDGTGTAGPIDSHYWKGPGSRAGGEREVVTAWPEVSMPMMERDYKGPRNYRDGGIQNMCVQGMRPDMLGCWYPTYDPQATGTVKHSDIAGTVRVAKGGGPHGETQNAAYVLQSVPRRLTPRECERLQGFPDDWTLVDHKGKPMSDGPRYRMMGNAVTVNVAEWVGRRILDVADLVTDTLD